MDFESLEIILTLLGECLWFHEIFRLRELSRALNGAILNVFRVKHLALAVIYGGNLDRRMKDVVAKILRRSMTSIRNIYSISDSYGATVDAILRRGATPHGYEDSYVTDILIFLKSSPSLQQLVLPSVLKGGQEGIFDCDEWITNEKIEECSLQKIILGQCAHRYRRELAEILSKRKGSELILMCLSTTLWPLVNVSGRQEVHKFSSLRSINLAIFEPKVDAWISLEDISKSYKSVWRPSGDSIRLYIDSLTGLQPLIVCFALQAFSTMFDERFKHLKTSLQINIRTLHVSVTSSRDFYSVKLLLSMICRNVPHLIGDVCYHKHDSSDNEAIHSHSDCPMRVNPWDLDWRPHRLEHDLSKCAEELSRFVWEAYKNSAEPEVLARWSREWTSALFTNMFQGESLRLTLEAALRVPHTILRRPQSRSVV